MSDQFASEHVAADSPTTLSGVEAAEQEMLHDTPATEEPSERDIEKRIDRMADHFEGAEYEAHRRDHIGLKRGDPEIHTPERVKASWERQAKFEAAEAATRQAIQEAEQGAQRASQPTDHDEVESRVAWERVSTKAQTHAVIYERESPGFAELTARTVAQHGPLSSDAAMSLGESDYSPQISEWLCLNADEGALAAFNAASPQERARFIHRFEGALENQGGTLIERPARQAPPRQSSAPKPVSTVKGASSVSAKTPDEMSYDEYAAWRQKSVARSSARSPRR